MSTIKDKLKSKIKAGKGQQILQSFDESSIEIKAAHGKTQLTEIKITCNWARPSIVNNTPELTCKWYNKTQNNIVNIAGIEGQSYQPCLVDVGSIIHIQCFPHLEGVQYEGMPIIKDIGPIVLSQQTEFEANELLGQGKASFFIEFKQLKIKETVQGQVKQGILKFTNKTMSLYRIKQGQFTDQLIKQIEITQNYPELIYNRKTSRQMRISLSEQEFAVILFNSSKKRDVAGLLNQLIVIKNSIFQQDQNKPQQKPELQVQQRPQIQLDHTELIPITKLQEKVNSLHELMNSVNSTSTKEESIKEETPRQFKSEESLESKEIIKSDIKISDSPIKQQSTTDLLNLSELKKQIKRLQADNIKIRKDVQSQKEKTSIFQEKYKESEERMRNLNKNYFQIESELNSIKANAVNHNEQLSYYHKQNQLLKEQNSQLTKKIANLQKNIQIYKNKLQIYEQKEKEMGQQLSYEELLNIYQKEKEMTKQMGLKCQFFKEQKDKMQEQLKNSRTIIQQAISQKKYLQKKYESLSFEISNGNSPALAKSRMSDVQLDMASSKKSRSSENDLINLKEEELYAKERENADLRKKCKDFAEENMLLRGFFSKEKSTSSKTQLKFELVQIKKIANKLAETIAEKDIAIENLKSINKQLNAKLYQMPIKEIQLQMK